MRTPSAVTVMAEATGAKRKREGTEESAESPGGGGGSFPLAELCVRRVLRESARDKAIFLHGQVRGEWAVPLWPRGEREWGRYHSDRGEGVGGGAIVLTR
uniref:Uncharacterized protein n=1 Tax=Chrysemys picta bellii TaxID=8478 RepID=A0A8C3F9S9_CHRPI